MVTASNTSSVGAAFTKAPNDSAFGKVFLNNMDSNSFTSHSLLGSNSDQFFGTPEKYVKS